MRRLLLCASTIALPLLIGCSSNDSTDRHRVVASEASESAAKIRWEVEDAIEHVDTLFEMLESKRCRQSIEHCKQELEEVLGSLSEAKDQIEGLEKEMNGIQFEADE